jgi:hypothetical protein
MSKGIRFCSVACYENAHEVIAPLQRTAEHFDVPLEFPIFKQEHNDASYLDLKCLQLLPSLEQWADEGTEIVFFVDARDTVFVDTAERMIDRYNEINPTGILHNGDWFFYPLDTMEMFQGQIGIANSGLCCGKIGSFIALFKSFLEIKNAIQNGDFTHPALSFSPEVCRVIGTGRYLGNDQFYAQLLHRSGSPLIQVDVEKKLLSMFCGCYPPLHPRTPYGGNDKEYIGEAMILHSPWMACDRKLWNEWIEREVLRRR